MDEFRFPIFSPKLSCRIETSLVPSPLPAAIFNGAGLKMAAGSGLGTRLHRNSRVSSEMVTSLIGMTSSVDVTCV